jgi:hypothetical protein
MTPRKVVNLSTGKVIIFIFILLATMSAIAQGAWPGNNGNPWPGQAGNAVGYQAWGSGVVGGSSCPTPTSGTSGNPTIIKNCTYGSAQSISGSYIWFIQVDFNAGTGGTNVSGSNILFLGSRFQSNATGSGNAGYNVQTSGSNIVFSYCTIAPLASHYTSPPGSTIWPTAGAQQNTSTQTNGGNAINGADGFQYGMNIGPGGTPVTVDHSDFWGYGQTAPFSNTTGQVIITNNWDHDAAYYGTYGYHTDGFGYQNAGTGPSNVWEIGNTVASLGPGANGLSWQAASGGYNNMQIINNYFSGFGFTLTPGDVGPSHFANSALVNNAWGTDVEPYYGIWHGSTLGNNSVMDCNHFQFAPNTTWGPAPGGGGDMVPISSMDGEYLMAGGNSTGTAAGSTDVGGNTVCLSSYPSSINFKTQTPGSASSSQTVKWYCTNTAACAITSIVMQSTGTATGTNFAITSNTCGSNVASGSTCTIEVDFSPAATGVYQDAVIVTSNMLAPSNSLPVPLLGIGYQTASTQAPNPPTGLSAVVQ